MSIQVLLASVDALIGISFNFTLFEHETYIFRDKKTATSTSTVLN